MTEQTAVNALAVVSEQPKPQAPAAPKAPLMAGHAPRAIVPIDFEGAYRIANVVTQAGMAPKTLETVEKAMVAILHGLEVGLTPMNALQSIAVINGRPTIWGDGAIGLIRASGLLEYMQETFEGEGDDLKAVCIVKRKGETKEVRGEFSWRDAKQAQLAGKAGPWQTYPRRMLQMRARWPLRDVFADVLKGLSLREEVEDMTPAAEAATPAKKRVVPSATPAAQIADDTKKVDADKPVDPGLTANGNKKRVRPSRAKAAQVAPADAANPAELTIHNRDAITADERDWLEGLNGAFSGCEDDDSLLAEQERLMTPHKNKVSPAAWNEADTILSANVQRLRA